MRTGCSHTQLHSVRAVMWLGEVENQSVVGYRNLIDIMVCLCRMKTVFSIM